MCTMLNNLCSFICEIFAEIYVEKKSHKSKASLIWILSTVCKHVWKHFANIQQIFFKKMHNFSLHCTHSVVIQTKNISQNEWNESRVFQLISNYLKFIWVVFWWNYRRLFENLPDVRSEWIEPFLSIWKTTVFHWIFQTNYFGTICNHCCCYTRWMFVNIDCICLDWVYSLSVMKEKVLWK